jgi:hypothetical protein
MARETACIYGAARRVNIATFLRENTSTSLSISQSGSTIMYVHTYADIFTKGLLRGKAFVSIIHVSL